MLSRDKSPAISGVKFCIYLDQWISVEVVVTEFYLRLRLGMTGNKFLERLKQMVDSDPADVVRIINYKHNKPLPIFQILRLLQEKLRNHHQKKFF